MRYARSTFAGATLLTAVSALPAYADHMLLMGTEDRGWRTSSFTSETPVQRTTTWANGTSIEPRAPAVAPMDPNSLAPATDTLDIDIKVGRESFRLGARFFGATGVWGAWLNGQSRKDGFSLDGRLQQPDRGYNFRLNADLDAWAKQALDQLLKP